MDIKILFNALRKINGKLTQKQVDTFNSLLTTVPINMLIDLLGIEELSANKKTSENGINIIKDFEGYMSKAYDDGVGVMTIGWGTCLEENTQIRMADGSVKKAKDIQKDEYVMGVDNNPKKVLARTEGTDKLIKIEGYDYEYHVTENHLLVFDKKMPKYNEKLKYLYGQTGGYYTKEAKHFLSCNERQLMYEARHSFDIPEREVLVDPYILGSWLGDGIKNYTLEFCQTDNEVLKYWKTIYPNHKEKIFQAGEMVKEYRGRRIINAEPFHVLYPKGNNTSFREYNLLHRQIKTGNYKAIKHIPEEYLENSERVRLEVLAGLIDTDGCVVKRKNRKQTGEVRFDFSVTNKTLIQDTVTLAQSLGFVVKQYYRDRESEGYPNPFVVLCITGELTKIPLKIQRKKDNLTDKIKPNRIQKVELQEIPQKWIGHTVEDSLILLKNGVVTHNTLYPDGTKVKKGDTCTKEQAESYLKSDLKAFEKTVNTVVTVDLTQNQFDALVSLCYNIGSGAFSKSTLVKKLNGNKIQEAADQFLVWNKGGGKVMQGLVKRRARERELFLKGN